MSIYDNDEIYDFEDDFEERPDPGPLSKMPQLEKIIPAAVFFLLCWGASTLAAGAGKDNLLWISGETFFRQKEYYRAFTSLLLHGDLVHLFANGPMILLFGWMLNGYFGFMVFPVMSLVNGMAASAATVFFYDSSIRLLGASGMAYAMAAQWLVLYVKFHRGPSLGGKIFRAAGFAMILLFPASLSRDTSYLAHTFGFLAGLLTTIAVVAIVKVRDYRDKKEQYADTHNNYTIH